MSDYSVTLEISGATAMWTRPDTGDAPVSYPAPTFGAVKGIFECILWSQWAEVVPTKVEICAPIVYHTYTTNYGGPLRKSKIMPAGSFQLIATVLINVCYRLHAALRCDTSGYHLHGRPGLQSNGTTNGAHAYKEVFERRLSRGQCFAIPCLGWKEFTPDYVGPFRKETEVRRDITLPPMASMLRTCFPGGKRSDWVPSFHHDPKPAQVKEGVMFYAE